ncbi:MAG: TolC family protein [Cytophagaceae bacterium]
MWNFWKYSVSALVFLGYSVHAQELLTPEQAVEEALRNNHNILVASSQKEIIAAGATLGNAGMLPTIDVAATQQHQLEDTRLSFYDGRMLEADNAASRNRNLGALLNWTIFDGLNMFMQYDRLREMNILEEYRLKETIENTVFETQQAYYDVVLQKQLLNAFAESMEISSQKLQLVEDKLEVGASSRAEFLQARVDYNMQRSNFLRQRTEVDNARVRLNQVMGSAPEREYEVVNTIVYENNLERESVYNNMLSSNNSLLQSVVGRNLAFLNKRSASSLYFPRINVYSSYNISSLTSEAGILMAAQANGWNYGVTASWRIFDGFTVSRAHQISKIQERQSEQLYHMTLHNLNSELRRGYNTYANNKELLELEEENMQLARENIALALDRFEAGVISAYELKEAELSFNEANSRLVSARFQAKVSELELLRISGRLVQ